VKNGGANRNCGKKKGKRENLEGALKTNRFYEGKEYYTDH
jgi:hypothetical protein